MTTKFDELVAKLKEILRVFRSQVYNSPNLRQFVFGELVSCCASAQSRQKRRMQNMKKSTVSAQAVPPPATARNEIDQGKCCQPPSPRPFGRRRPWGDSMDDAVVILGAT